MKISTYLRKNIPELFLLLATFFYMFASVGFSVNPIAVVFVLIISAQMYFKNKTTGILLASVFILIFSYLFLALFSDLIKLESLTDGWQMLVFGTLYLGISLAAAIFMVRKYVRMDEPKKKLLQ